MTVSDGPGSSGEPETAALVHDLDRLIASSRVREAESARSGGSPHDQREWARHQAQRARELREAAESMRHRVLALRAETQALVDRAHCAGIEVREWSGRPGRSGDLVGPASLAHPASVPFATPEQQHPALVRAVRFVEEHAGEAIGVADIVRAAGVGTRHLQGLFRGDHQVTPTAYLRRVRLERAHRELCRADPADGTTVEEIARRWQFTHLGRFASAYRERFGRVPSRTLRAMPAEPSVG